MKNLKNYLVCAAVAGFQFVNAQDNNDTNIASHILNVDVPEVALLDIFDANTNTEAAAILFDMSDATVSGINAEAGLYDFQALSYTNLYLNYTSVVAGASNANGYDLTRKINVRFETGSTFPGNLDLRITPDAPVIVTDGGTVDSAGTVVATGVALGKTVPVGTDALLVDSIESVYTGDDNQGVKLTYTVEQNGNFASFKAGSYQSTIVYTLTDL
ncbi:hypothetical protein [Leeuwenhoekiella sp. W20_SRS_FM14]|uniref:hypothetical protein n=1 Tax=Leeuwenhoekiella sp. W20_SRS_FM14 TaxID=3240270 RepID=UPI003F995B58